MRLKVAKTPASVFSGACHPAALSLKILPPSSSARMRSWRVSLLRGRAQPLGTVEAPDERAAEAAAVEQFQLNDEQRKRLAVREE